MKFSLTSLLVVASSLAVADARLRGESNFVDEPAESHRELMGMGKMGGMKMSDKGKMGKMGGMKMSDKGKMGKMGGMKMSEKEKRF